MLLSLEHSFLTLSAIHHYFLESLPLTDDVGICSCYSKKKGTTPFSAPVTLLLTQAEVIPPSHTHLGWACSQPCMHWNHWLASAVFPILDGKLRGELERAFLLLIFYIHGHSGDVTELIIFKWIGHKLLFGMESYKNWIDFVFLRKQLVFNFAVQKLTLLIFQVNANFN